MEFYIDMDKVAEEAALLVSCSLIDDERRLPIPEAAGDARMPQLVADAAVRLAMKFSSCVAEFGVSGGKVTLGLRLVRALTQGEGELLSRALSSCCAASAAAAWLSQFSLLPGVEAVRSLLIDQVALLDASLIECLSRFSATVAPEGCGPRRTSPSSAARRPCYPF